MVNIKQNKLCVCVYVRSVVCVTSALHSIFVPAINEFSGQ